MLVELDAGYIGETLSFGSFVTENTASNHLINGGELVKSEPIEENYEIILGEYIKQEIAPLKIQTFHAKQKG